MPASNATNDLEQARIQRIASVLRPAPPSLLRGIGDDAAVVASRGFAVTSVDASVDGVHFDRALFSPEHIGYKAAASALSDLAAMGVAAGEIYVALGIPPDLTDDEFDGVRDGIVAAADDAGAVLAGGDLTSASKLWLAVTVVGWCEHFDSAIGREGAMAGQIVAVTGELGGAAAGLALVRGTETPALDDHTIAALRARQTHPRPRHSAGCALAKSTVSAMIDISDGIAKDAGQIASASGVCLRIELTDLPLQAGVTEVAGQLGVPVAELSAAGGEDYELLVTLDQAHFAAAKTAVEATGSSLTKIGVVVSGAGLQLTNGGQPASLTGYRHFG
ncbi:MAG: thiamine-phosphate kinase [Thermoleophilaceae bacterium]|nr:thiamine-phosphate kinase [Thermoleophilaceae bacterium]